MNLMLVAVAFASLSAVQADQAPSGASEPGSGPARNAATTVPAPANEQPAAERQICRRLVVSGSNRPRRLCMTAEQWRQQED